MKNNIDAIWAEVRAKEKELIEAGFKPEVPVKDVMVPVIPIGPVILVRRNELYDKLWIEMQEKKAQFSRPRPKKIDEKQLFLFQ